MGDALKKLFALSLKFYHDNLTFHPSLANVSILLSLKKIYEMITLVRNGLSYLCQF